MTRQRANSMRWASYAMPTASKLQVAALLAEYCLARDCANVDALDALLGDYPVFDSQKFREPLCGREVVLSHLRLEWEYMRSAQHPHYFGRYRLCQVAWGLVVDVPCAVLYRGSRADHVCFVEPDAMGRVQSICLFQCRGLRSIGPLLFDALHGSIAAAGPVWRETRVDA